MKHLKIATTNESIHLEGSTIFIAGAYGTGKSTICSSLTETLHIPSFSAGDLIGSVNGEKYGANKTVSDKNANQQLLSECVRQLILKNKIIILAGHFCIFDANNGIDILPESVYSTLYISRIILLEADVQSIIANLYRRDGKNYSWGSISTLIKKEREQSKRIAEQLNCPLNIYHMTFTDQDLNNIASLIREGN